MHIRRTLVVFIFIISCLQLFSQGNLRANAHEGGVNESVVHMSESGFSIQEIKIDKGDTVIFENTDKVDHWPASDDHPTHQKYPSLDPGSPIAPQGKWRITLTDTGNWGVHDHLFPDSKMKIVVSEENISQSNSTSKIRDFFKSILARAKSILRLENVSDHKTKSSPSVQTPFISPPSVDIDELKKTYKLICAATDRGCIHESFKTITATHGPQAAIDLLTLFISDGRVSKQVEDHQIAHQIGRQTAQSFGVNPQAFLLCPMTSFNGGCQHGYFEYILGKTETPTGAANLICASLDQTFSDKFKFYCYHGVGHGLMMAKAYDLKETLSTCDTLEQPWAKDGCWQGVFMENVVASFKGEAREGVFSDTDVLAPCTGVEEKYRYQCFINHSGRLMYFFQNDIEKAAAACLKAPPPHTSTCIQSLGLLLTNPSWQIAIKGQDTSITHVRVAIDLCQRFPLETQKDCYIGALDNALNNDGTNLKLRALPFCKYVTGWDKKDCYRQIGINIARQVVDINQRKMLCQEVDVIFQASCLVGAGI